MPSDWQPPADVPVTLVSVAAPDGENAGVAAPLYRRPIPGRGPGNAHQADFANYGSHPATRTAVLTLDDHREEQAVASKRMPLRP